MTNVEHRRRIPLTNVEYRRRIGLPWVELRIDDRIALGRA